MGEGLWASPTPAAAPPQICLRSLPSSVPFSDDLFMIFSGTGDRLAVLVVLELNLSLIKTSFWRFLWLQGTVCWQSHMCYPEDAGSSGSLLMKWWFLLDPIALDLPWVALTCCWPGFAAASGLRGEKRIVWMVVWSCLLIHNSESVDSNKDVIILVRA